MTPLGFVIRLSNGDVYKNNHGRNASIFKTLKGAQTEFKWLKDYRFGPKAIQISPIFYDERQVMETE